MEFFKDLRKHTVRRWHKDLTRRWFWYRLWHKSPLHHACHWVMLIIFAVGIFMGSAATFFYKDGRVTAQIATPSTGMWIPNNTVRAVAVGGDGTVYIGGDFTQVGPNTGSGMPVNTSTGAVTTSFPFVNGAINAVVSDGSSGWFIGGDFTKVGSTTRNYLAHLNSSGVVDSTWDPNPNSSVYALVSDGTNLYVGGSFTSIGGQSRNRLAAVSLTGAGTATTWDPNTNNTVYALVLNPLVTKIYAGGDFTTIGATTRNRIASFTLSDGALEAWDPNVNGSVRALLTSANGNILYAGGDFTAVGASSRARNRAAGFNTSLSFPTDNWNSWDPDADGLVLTLAIDGSNVIYLGGAFTTLGGSARNYLAAVSGTFGAETAFDPNANGAVNALKVSGTTLYAGGSFTTFGATPTTRNYIAALDTTSNTDNSTSWDPNASAKVNALALSGSTIYVGGSFLSIGGVTRNRLAAISPSTGQATSWNPNANNSVNALVVSGSTIYAGGSFTTVNGSTTRNRLAAFDTSGTVTSWDPNMSSTVNTLAISGSTVYAGGSFTAVNGGTTRNRLAAFDTSSGTPSTATSWNPGVSDAVQSIAISGTTLYVGGTFITIGGGASRNSLAAVSTSDTGTATSWDPNMNSTVNAVSISGSTVYAGGSFTTVNGSTTRNRLAAFDTSSSTATAWDPNASGLVRTLLATSSTVYAGGDFNGSNSVNGSTTRNYLAALDTSNGTARSWDPNPNNSVYAMYMNSATLYLAGNFTTVDGSNLSRLTWFAPPSVTFASSSQTSSEGAGTTTITVQLSAASSQDVSVPFTLTGTATGSGTDYSVTSPVTISAGSTTGTITVTLTDDTLDEDDETIIVTMGTPTNATQGATTVHTITVTDNDAPPTVSFSAASSSGLESVTAVVLTVSLSTASSKTVTAAYATANGTASSGSDYTAASGTATIAAGSTSTTVHITVADDGVDESDETFTVTLSSPSNATLGSTAVNTYTIGDNDGSPTISFSTSASSGAETVTSVSLSLVLTAVSGQNVTVDYAATGGTATGGGVDYTLASGTATVTAGETSATIPLTVVADSTDEPNETIIVTISNPVNTSLGSLTTHTYTINGSDAFLPATPVNATPSASAQNISLTPALTASAFSDQGGDAHHGSQWLIRTESGNFSQPLFDSGTDTTNRTSLTVASDTLTGCALYYWRVRYLSTAGGWSAYSSETSFRTTNCGSAAASAAAAAVASATTSTADSGAASGSSTGAGGGLSATTTPTATATAPAVTPEISSPSSTPSIPTPEIPVDSPSSDVPSSFTGPLSPTAIQISLTDTTPANAREYRLYRGKQIHPGRLRVYPGHRQGDGQTVVVTIDNLTPNTKYADFYLTKVTTVGIESEPLALPAVTTSVAPLSNVQLEPVATASGELRGVAINFNSANPPATEYQVMAVSDGAAYYLNTTGRLRREPVWFTLSAWTRQTVFFLPPRQAGRYTLSLKARNRDLIETAEVGAGSVQVDL